MSAMIFRTAFIGAIALVLSSVTAEAQGKAPTQVVISKAVMKSMVANKPKSKTRLGAKAGIVRRKGVAAATMSNAAPTSVRELKPIPKKN